MAHMVLTVIGDDRAGLVDALSRVIADHDGNWEESHMAELAGKFAGIVLATVPDRHVEALTAALQPLRDQGLLDITAERASEEVPDAPRSRMSLHLEGLDQPGIVRDVSHALAALDVSIETLETSTTSAPMSAETLFIADAAITLPVGVEPGTVADVLEDLAHQLMVDIEVHTSQ